MGKNKISGIYIIRSLIDDRIYIGSTNNIKIRLYHHKRDLMQNKHGNSHLQNFVNKHGIDNLTFNIYIECQESELIKKEQHYIDLLNPKFNICKVAKSRLGVKNSQSTREKIRISHLGNKYSLGTKRTEESKKLMSSIQKELTKGSKNARAKLREEDVLEIRELCKTKTNKEISKMYNINHRSVSNIKLRISWTHI